MQVDPLQFASDQLERASKGLEIAASTGNVQLFALNARQMFKHNHMCGLIVWRNQINPTPYFEKAISGLAEAMNGLLRMEPSFDLRENLPVGRLALLANLTSIEVTERLTPTEDQPVELQLDLLLAQDGCDSPRIQRLLSTLSQDKRLRLAAETYQNYFDLIVSRGDDSRIEVLTRAGENLYLRRSADSFYSGGDQTEGGGPANELVVDYRLAIALKASKAKFISQHSWLWAAGAA